MSYQFSSREYVAMLRVYVLCDENASAAVRMYLEASGFNKTVRLRTTIGQCVST